MQTDNVINLPLLSAVPLGLALLGYLLCWYAPALARRINGWLGLGALLVSAGLAAGILPALLQPGSSVSFLRPWLLLPDVNSYILSNPHDLMTPLPLAFQASLPNMLFALSCALIGAAVMLYALRERADDERRGLFFAHLTLFSGAMLLLLSADTLLVIYAAWELMGLCSYLLIAYRGTPLALRAARTAFWTTRATDFGLLFAVILLLARFHVVTLSHFRVSEQLDFLGINIAQNFYQRALDLHVHSLPLEVWFGSLAILVLLAALGKSGQFPLTFWLSGAMAAPTPVSAMLHAATMVAAGPYLLYRMSGLFFDSNGTAFGGSGLALLLACLVGGLTLILGGLMALCADDAKRVLAYSTASQLGLAIIAVGCLSEGDGLWQLMAHAWAKAALFLAVGYLAATIPGHSTSLKALRGATKHPLLRLTLLLAALSLAGLPLLPGGIAKESILAALWTRGSVVIDSAKSLSLGAAFPLAQLGWLIAGVLVVLSIPLTAAYLFRLVGLLAWAKPAVEPAADEAVVPEARGWQPALLATVALALIGSLGLAAFYYLGHLSTRLPRLGLDWALAGAPLPTELAVAGLSLVLILAGIWLAFQYNVARPQAGAALLAARPWMARTVQYFRCGMLLRQFFERVIGHTGWLLARASALIDARFVDRLIAKGLPAAGNAIARGSGRFDRSVVDGLRWRFCEIWWGIRRAHNRFMQTGYIQHYMFVILVGAVLLCLIILRPLSETFKEILIRR